MYVVFCPRPSRSSRDLAVAVGGRRVSGAGNIRPNDVVINWGNSRGLDNVVNRVFNEPEAIFHSSNKLRFLELIQRSQYCIPYTTSIDDARDWVNQGHKVFVRTQLTGHSGNGIVVAKTSDDLVEARLYTLGVRKSQEFRVHILNNRVIDVQRKARRHNHEHPNWDVRNHRNGFIYAREGVMDIPYINRVIDAAKSAHSRNALDFGAYDVITRKEDDFPYVLEVNTAPGLTGTTLERYAQAFNAVKD